MNSIRIRSYITVKDERAVFELWQNLLGEMWPLSQETFHHAILFPLVSASTHHFVAEKDGAVIEFIAVIAEDKAEIMCLLVSKNEQRKGIGAKLLNTGLDELKKKKITEVHLGSGTHTYFWPGVPTNLPVAINFFKKNGFIFESLSADMVLDLNTYQTPPFVFERVKEIMFELIKEIEVDKALTFEKDNFPEWWPYYQRAAKEKRLNNVLLAKTADNRIVGTVFVGERLVTWEKLLGSKVGSLGALGVAENMRSRGIGLALAARGTEIMQEKGLTKVYLGWTELTDWYGRLGYQIWREFAMGSLKF